MKKKVFCILLLLLALPVAGSCGITEKDCGISDEDGLISYYNLNEGDGAVASDAAGPNTATLNGSPSWADGRACKGLHFDGVDDYADCGSDASLNFEFSSRVTFMFWIKMDDQNAAGSHDIISKVDMMGGNVQRGFRIFQYPGTVINFQLANERVPGLKYFNVYTAGGIGSGWHHVAITYAGDNNANNVNMYVDGSAVGKGVEKDALSGTIQNAKSMVLGRITDGGSSFPGSLDEVRIYNRVLNASEISQLAGNFTSWVLDGGAKRSYRTNWVPSSSKFSVRGSPDEASLKAAPWVQCVPNAVVVIDRYFQYRADISVTAFSSFEISPFFIRSMMISPSPPVKSGPLAFEVNFTDDMMRSNTPTISFTADNGIAHISNMGAAGSGWQKGSWLADDHYKVIYLDVNALTGNGQAIVRINGLMTQTGDTMPEYSDPFMLYIDSDDLAGSGIGFFPNPFSPNNDGRNDSTYFLNIPVLSSITRISIRIYTLKGACVKILFDGEGTQGSVSIPPWDGTDDTGKVCPVGLYLFQARIGDSVRTGTVVLSK